MPKKTDFTLKNKSGESILHQAARTRTLQKYAKDIQENPSLLGDKANGGVNVLHVAAVYGVLNQIPKEAFTSQTLNAQDYYGETPIQIAICKEGIDQIPKEALTKEALEIQDNDEQDGFTKAIIYNQLEKIPLKLLTHQKMCRDIVRGKTLLETIAQHNREHTIPTPILWIVRNEPIIRETMRKNPEIARKIRRYYLAKIQKGFSEKIQSPN